jgi:hypothetical protein
MSNAMTAHRAPAWAPFVCSVIGRDAGETLEHIIVRKEAERSTGTAEHAGEFWWGLSAPLGPDVEAQAQQNGGTLPALFSRSNNSQVQHYSQVWIWDEWQSVLDPRRGGRIPNHVIVTSGPKKKPSDGHYALICHSNQKLTLGSLGYCDLAPPHCRTLKNRKSLKYITGARLLEKQLPLFSRKGSPSASVRSVEFEASLIGHCYVKLRGIPRVLTQAQLNSLRQYQPGDDWLGLVKKLRP